MTAKFLLLASVVFCSFSAKAESYVSDIAGLPEQGKFWATAGLSLVDQKLDVELNGSVISEAEVDTTIFSARLIWGLSDKMSLGLDLNFLIAQDTTTTSDPNGTPSVEETGASGLVDPTFRFAYRILEEQSSGFNLDLQTFFAPKLLTEKNAVVGTDGNGGNGQSVLGVGVDFNWLKTANQYLVTVGVVHFFEGESEEADDATATSVEEAQTNFVLALGVRRQINDSWAVSLTETITLEGEDTTIDEDGDELTVDSVTTFTTAAGLEYHVVPKTSLIELQVLHKLQPNTDANSDGTAIEVTNIKQLAFALNYKQSF